MSENDSGPEKSAGPLTTDESQTNIHTNGHSSDDQAFVRGSELPAAEPPADSVQGHFKAAVKQLEIIAEKTDDEWLEAAVDETVLDVETLRDVDSRFVFDSEPPERFIKDSESTGTDSTQKRSLMDRAVLRLHRALVFHGFIKHPYGRDYARDHYSPLGGRRQPCPDCNGSLRVVDGIYAGCTDCEHVVERNEVGL